MSTTITLAEISAMLQEETPVTKFVRQGNGSTIHISDGDFEDTGVLHGATYARNGAYSSYIYPIKDQSVQIDSLCKKCYQRLQHNADFIAKNKVVA